MSDDHAWDRLVRAGWLFAGGSAIHLIDHLRRGQGSITEELYWLGNVALVLQVVVITLVVTRHERAPSVAAVGGSVLGIGFLAAHWVPEWSAVSDPVWQIDSLVWFSTLASTAEIVGAFAVAAAGMSVVRSRDHRHPPGSSSIDERSLDASST